MAALTGSLLVTLRRDPSYAARSPVARGRRDRRARRLADTSRAGRGASRCRSRDPGRAMGGRSRRCGPRTSASPRRSTPLTTLNVVVTLPIPTPSVSTTTAAIPGDWRSARHAPTSSHPKPRRSPAVRWVNGRCPFIRCASRCHGFRAGTGTSASETPAGRHCETPPSGAGPGRPARRPVRCSGRCRSRPRTRRSRDSPDR